MRRVILTLMASLLSCSTVSAFWPEAVASSLEIGVLYRNDEIIRKTGSSCSSGCSSSSSSLPYEVGAVSDSRSKIKYKNLNIWGIQAGGKYVTCDDIYLRACGDYGWITSGRAHHSDYLTSNESFDYDYSYGGRGRSNHVKGHVYDLKLGVGYLFHWCDDSFGIAPVIGYAWNGQHLKQHRRNNDSSCDYSDSYSSYYSDYSSYGSGDNDRTKYSTRWNGPFVGFDADYKFLCEWSLFGGYEFHWGSFHAKGRDGRNNVLENLGLFNSKFHQRSERVYGHVLDVGVKYDLCDCWTLAVKGEFQWWEASHGHSRTKVRENDIGCRDKEIITFKQRMKKVEWYSAGVTLDVGTVF